MRTETIRRSFVSLRVDDDDDGRRRRNARTAASSSSSNAPFDDDSDDLYEILNLSQPYESLTKRDIKTAFRKRALETHPDRNKKPNASEEFNKCKRAYNTLSDDRLRKEYDRKRLFWKKNGGGNGSSSSASSKATIPPKSDDKANKKVATKDESVEDMLRALKKQMGKS